MNTYFADSPASGEVMPGSDAPSLFLRADVIYYNEAGRLYRICFAKQSVLLSNPHDHAVSHVGHSRF